MIVQQTGVFPDLLFYHFDKSIFSTEKIPVFGIPLLGKINRSAYRCGYGEHIIQVYDGVILYLDEIKPFLDVFMFFLGGRERCKIIHIIYT